MSSYQADFEKHIADARSAISNVGQDIKEYAPELSSPKIRRLLDSIRVLLGRIDRDGAKYPEQLFDYDGHVPAIMIEQIASTHIAISKGIESFVKNFISRMVEGEQSLLRAVGHSKSVVNAVRDENLKALQDSVAVSSELLERTRENRRTIDAQRQAIENSSKNLTDFEARAAASLQAVEKVRTLAHRLASGDTKTQMSLERLARDSRAKYAESAALVSQINGVLQSSLAVSTQMEATNTEMSELLVKLHETESKADLARIIHWAGGSRLADVA